MSCATRIKFTPGLSPLTMMGPPRTYTPVNFPHPRMQGIIPVNEVHVPTQAWTDTFNDDWMSHQQFPPFTLYRMNAEELLNNWALTGKTKAWEDFRRNKDRRQAIHNMRYAIFEEESVVKALDKPATPGSLPFDGLHLTNLLSSRREHEMVGLIPKVSLESRVAPDTKNLEREVDQAITSIVALGVFSRKTLEDDYAGTFRRHIQKRYRKQGSRRWWGRTTKHFDIFEIEGLADAPGLPESSTGLLLSKIKKYAHKEQKLVVVPRRACIRGDGTDLTEYYVRLGFEKVRMTDGRRKLVYTGAVSPTEKLLVRIHSNTIMVGISLE